MWSTEYSTNSELQPEDIWKALRDWSTGVVPAASGDRHELRGPSAVGSTIATTLPEQDGVLATTIIAVVADTVFATDTPYNGLSLLNHYSLQRLTSGGTRITHSLAIGGEGADEAAPQIGPHIVPGFPEAMEDLLDVARNGAASTP